MIAHTDAFRFFTDIAVIAQVLLIGLFIHPVDQTCQQLAETVGGHLVDDAESSVVKQLSGMGDRIEDEREVIQTERLLVVIPVQQKIGRASCRERV